MENTYEKERILNYMKANCCGYMNAKPRREIVNATFIDDRSFRDICAEIPEIITSSKKGYYVLPDVPSVSEQDIALEAIKEHRRRAISSLTRLKGQRNFIRGIRDSVKQPVLF